MPWSTLAERGNPGRCDDCGSEGQARVLIHPQPPINYLDIIKAIVNLKAINS